MLLIITFLVLGSTAATVGLATPVKPAFKVGPPGLPEVPPNTVFVGHSSADVDAYCSAMAAADLFGGEYALAAGHTTLDIQYVIDYFKYEQPRLSTDPAFANATWAITDHNSVATNPKGVSDKVVMIIDHHQIVGGVAQTDAPRMVDIQPWGSACTVLFYLYQEYGKTISQDVANCLLAGIVADTLNGTSPTNTPNDAAAVKALLDMSSVANFNEFVQDMFAAKSRLDNVAAYDIVRMDSKDYDVAGKKVIYAVAETQTAKELVDTRSDELMAAIKERKAAEKADIMLFSATDIGHDKPASYQFCVTDNECQLLEEMFPKGTWYVPKQVLYVPDVVSRKKDMIPRLTCVLEHTCN